MNNITGIKKKTIKCQKVAIAKPNGEYSIKNRFTGQYIDHKPFNCNYRLSGDFEVFRDNRKTATKAAMLFMIGITRIINSVPQGLRIRSIGGFIPRLSNNQHKSGEIPYITK